MIMIHENKISTRNYLLPRPFGFPSVSLIIILAFPVAFPIFALKHTNRRITTKSRERREGPARGYIRRAPDLRSHIRSLGFTQATPLTAHCLLRLLLHAVLSRRSGKLRDGLRRGGKGKARSGAVGGGVMASDSVFWGKNSWGLFS